MPADSQAALGFDTAVQLGASRDYSAVKDPACDLIMEAAEAWAAQKNWSLGASDP